jgi:hypothetical protein
MSGIIAFVLLAVVALIVVSAFVHILFSPWILLAIAIVAFVKLRPRRGRARQQ